jgi:tetratricopeptide (TPR) repeat protein
MSAKNKTKGSQETGNELLENPEALVEQFSKTEEFVAKNKTLVIGVLGALVLIIGGFAGYTLYKNSQNKRGLSDMFQAEFYFEADSLALALNGDGLNLGFVEITKKYAGTEAGNLANFYAGVIYLRQGAYPAAIAYLDDFSSSDLLVQARAYSLMGDAYMEQEKFEDAVKYYNKAASHRPNKQFTPRYLLKAALAYELLNNKTEAIKTYGRIIDEFWDAAEVQTAKKYKARLESSAS